MGAWMLDVGRVVLGFGVAIQAFVAPAYIGEISPKNTRGGFTAANQVKIGKEKDLDATLQCLRGKDADVSQEAAEIRRKYAHSLTIGLGLLLLAIFGGIVGISYYASTIYEAAGCSVSVGTTTMAIVQIPFLVLGLLLTDKIGRRPLWMISAAGTCLANFLIGLGFLLQLYVATFSAGMASTPWVVVSEMLPIDIKGPAGSLITFCNWASAWVVSYGYIFILDWSPAGTFFIHAGICASTVVFVAKLVPETKG